MTSPASGAFRDFFDQLVPKLLKTARKIIADGEEHVPVVFLFFDNGTMGTVGMDMDDKDSVAHALRFFANEPGVFAAVYIVEAWTVSEDASEWKKIKGSLEHVPGRGECVMITARHRDQQLIASCPIRRPSEGGKQGSTIDDAKIIDPTSTLASERFVDVDDETKH